MHRTLQSSSLNAVVILPFSEGNPTWQFGRQLVRWLNHKAYLISSICQWPDVMLPSSSWCIIDRGGSYSSVSTIHGKPASKCWRLEVSIYHKRLIAWLRHQTWPRYINIYWISPCLSLEPTSRKNVAVSAWNYNVAKQMQDLLQPSSGAFRLCSLQ